MFNSYKRVSLPWRTPVARVERPLAGLLMAVGLTVGATYLPALGSEAAQQTKNQPETASMADGVYLYGQSTRPNQIGSEYLVFEVTQGRVIGGFYMPNSSFDCFHGNVEAERLALTVIDSYEQTAHPYAVALQSEGNVASTGGASAPFSLQGYHRLENLSAVDQNVLATCKADQG